MEKIKLGILGATGMAGRDAVLHQQKLEKEGHDYAELELVTGSPSSEGQRLGAVFREKEKALEHRYDFWSPLECPEKYQDMKVRGLDAEKIAEEVDYVISALPSSVAAKIEPKLREKGVHIFSNASEFRWDTTVPLMIPEVNPEAMEMIDDQKTPGVQVNNPNCTTAGYVPLIAALKQKFDIKNVDLITMQSISGKGDKVSSKEYSCRIRGNAIDDWDRESNHNGEEIKSEIEPQKILGLANTKKEAGNTDLDINAQTTRISSQYGHLESLRIEFSNDISEEEVKEAINCWNPSRKVRDLPSTPEKSVKFMESQPEPRENVFEGDGMTVCIGDIRKIDDNRISLYSLSHNLRRGATWTARQSMELYLYREGIL